MTHARSRDFYKAVVWTLERGWLEPDPGFAIAERFLDLSDADIEELARLAEDRIAFEIRASAAKP